MALDPNTCISTATLEELKASSWGMGTDGFPILRMMNVTDAGTDAITCGQDPSTFDERQLYGVDSNGKVALRVSIDGL